MPSYTLTCRYCKPVFLTKSERYLEHILSKHEEEFFSDKFNSATLHTFHSKSALPTFKFNGEGELWCCLACKSALKNVKKAITHMPTCYKAHYEKVKELKEKYPFKKLTDISGTIVQNTVHTVSTVTTTIVKLDLNHPLVLAMLGEYHKRYEEDRREEKKNLKRDQKIRKWLERKHPEILEEYKDIEDVSDASSVEEDPNVILEPIIKKEGIVISRDEISEKCDEYRFKF